MSKATDAAGFTRRIASTTDDVTETKTSRTMRSNAFKTRTKLTHVQKRMKAVWRKRGGAAASRPDLENKNETAFEDAQTKEERISSEENADGNDEEEDA